MPRERSAPVFLYACFSIQTFEAVKICETFTSATDSRSKPFAVPPCRFRTLKSDRPSQSFAAECLSPRLLERSRRFIDCRTSTSCPSQAYSSSFFRNCYAYRLRHGAVKSKGFGCTYVVCIMRYNHLSLCTARQTFQHRAPRDLEIWRSTGRLHSGSLSRTRSSQQCITLLMHPNIKCP